MDNDKDKLNADVISRKLRSLSIVTGCFSAAGLAAAFGWVAPVVPCFLILGAVIQPRSPQPGRWLMWVGALLLSMATFPLSVETLFDGPKILRVSHDSTIIVIFSLSLVSTLLVLWCDIALVIDAVMLKRDQWARGTLDWLVWIVAIILTAWWLSTGVRYWLHGRFSNLPTTVGLGVVILSFDFALIIHRLKIRARPAE